MAKDEIPPHDHLGAKRQGNDIDRLVGARIRERRTQLGLSQSVVGAAVGLSYQQVQKYESGVNRVSAGLLYAIALYLGADVEDFYDGADRIDLSINPHPRAQDIPMDQTFASGTQLPTVGNAEIEKCLRGLANAIARSPHYNTDDADAPTSEPDVTSEN